MGLFRVMNSMGGQSKLIEDCIWDYENGFFQQGAPEMRDMRTVGKAFYTSSYICPKCRRFMLKANAGEYVGVRTTQGVHRLKSVFACDNCKMLYSALPGQNLSQGNYYVLKDKSKFKKVVDTIDTYGVSVEQLQQMRW